ncbi:helix-turn-helix transcriptional regulator [Anaerovorax odorimutans]|uniref:Helix-turn-helix transcriptional regulator n=1 Tax=Anaerovorax odorimutans TaxID=109327 RepID=A0ABT1RS51_9FIRM|nr:helix-turn-helix transcriptional regulator [Anaerovorax odorimutans]MCQ4638003.1 helix-turn-helix transcriptional regulator [Anaerovorax odorimutans]
MGIITSEIAGHIKEKGINVSKMARDTGVSYQALYASLCDEDRKRSLRDDELIAVCKFLDINPMEFANEPKRTG